MLMISYGLFIYLFYSTVQYQNVQLTRLGRLQSQLPDWGPSRWLWLGKISSQAKSRLRPTVWPGLAWLFLAQLGLRPGLAHHYSWGLLLVASRRPSLFTCKYPLISTADQVNRTRSIPVEAKHAFGYLQPPLTPDCVHPHMPNIVSFVAPSSLDQNAAEILV